MTPKQILLEYNIDAKEHSGLLEFVIEQYSNIKITELKDKVLEFKQKLINASETINHEILKAHLTGVLNSFTNHFNLENEKK